MRRALNSMKSDEALERILDMFIRTRTNAEFIEIIKRPKLSFRYCKRFFHYSSIKDSNKSISLLPNCVVTHIM